MEKVFSSVVSLSLYSINNIFPKAKIVDFDKPNYQIFLKNHAFDVLTEQLG